MPVTKAKLTRTQQRKFNREQKEMDKLLEYVVADSQVKERFPVTHERVDTFWKLKVQVMKNWIRVPCIHPTTMEVVDTLIPLSRIREVGPRENGLTEILKSRHACWVTKLSIDEVAKLIAGAQG
jgi:hypothetical protein